MLKTERLLEDAIKEAEHSSSQAVNMAEIYCLVAIAQELKRMNDRLDKWEDGGPRYPGLRTWTTNQP